jgi:hypothetical protein
VRCEDGVNQGRLSQPGLSYTVVRILSDRFDTGELTNTDDVELKPSLEQLLLDLLSDAIKPNVAPWEDCIALWHCHSHYL